ncbi:MAG: hypothetical protein NTU88_11210 [Armatimonadetes bacterium]|nr:hypothetical protein [Armatimonadota bacterium]
MRDTPYYSIRTGKHKDGSRLDLPMFKRLFLTLYSRLCREGYFQEALGYDCVDAGYVSGTLGPDVPGALLLTLRKDNLWPLEEKLEGYGEDDLFDMVECLYDHVSKPVPGSGYYHDWNNCGWHYGEFDSAAGRAEFRAHFNEIARDYDDGYQLSEQGEILLTAESGFGELLLAPLPVCDKENVRSRVDLAKRKFLRHRSSLADRRDAVRELADVLEYLRPKLEGVLTRKDEADLFNIANNFGIRHHNAAQKTEYDKAVWYTWMFYYYLATISAVMRLIKKAEAKPSLELPE